jgi:HEAT repeat protein
MKKALMNFLDLQEEEYGRVMLMLIMSFFMGVFLATFSVAANSLFLNHFDETNDLPLAIVVSGALGVLATAIFNILQNRIPFSALALLSLSTVVVMTGLIEFGEGYAGTYFGNENAIFYLGYALQVPFFFISLLVFWGAFGRLFTLKASKRLMGSVDLGAVIASLIGFFSIPIILPLIEIHDLYTIALASVTMYLILYIPLVRNYLANKTFMETTGSQLRADHKGMSLFSFLGNRYLLAMAAFIIVSMVAFKFIEYSFLTVTSIQYPDERQLTNFLSLFEAAVVIFAFLFQTFVADRVIADYGLRVSLIVNPILLAIFTTAALGLGIMFGYKVESPTFVFFFLMIAMSRLFVSSLKDALDSPTFKLYYLPIDARVKIDVQTKIDGIVTALASLIAGGAIYLIIESKILDLIYITVFTLPILGLWYLVTNRMYSGYRHTLQDTLVKNKEAAEAKLEKEFTLNRVLEKQVSSPMEDRVLYGLKLMERLEPALFETSILQLADNSNRRIREFAQAKLQSLGISDGKDADVKALASQAAGASEDSDLLSITPDKLMKLSKSAKQADRLLAVKLLRRLISAKNIFILLELLRDVDPRVRMEAVVTARKVKRPESWPVLIELLSSPMYGQAAAAALEEAGPPALNALEGAFHKSGQSDLVMLKLVQIMGRIGGSEAMNLLWKKIDYPNKRIVRQILYLLRYTDYRARGREINEIKDLLDLEIGKALWNISAINELPDEAHFRPLKESLREEVADNYDQITMLLSIIYDPESVQLVRENIESGTSEGIAFALELLDLFIDKDLKPKLFPLFDDNSPEEKLKALQVYFPRESYSPIQVVNYVINRDFNQNNRWSKMCAVYAAAYMPEFRLSRGLVGQMFNSDRMLQETAAWVIYNKDREAYASIAQRLPLKDKRFLDSAIESNQLLDGLDDGFFLNIEMVMFLKDLPEFKNMGGNLLTDLAEKITPITLKPGERHEFNPDEENSPVFIVAHGAVKLKRDQEIIRDLKVGAVYGDLFQDRNEPKGNAFEAAGRAVVFRINLVDFYFVMASHHDMVQDLIRNMTGDTKVTAKA